MADAKTAYEPTNTHSAGTDQSALAAATAAFSAADRLGPLRWRHGEAARLDADIQAAVEAFRDPWMEAVEPRTANQFRSVLEEAAS